MEGEVLNLKFSKHNWFAPTIGHLCRFSYYAFDYSSGVAVERENYPLSTITDSKGKIVFKTLSVANGLFSSSEYNNSSAWTINLGNGAISGYGKNNHLLMRPICAF
jgi:hypothetical protein